MIINAVIAARSGPPACGNSASSTATTRRKERARARCRSEGCEETGEPDDGAVVMVRHGQNAAARRAV